MASGTRFYSFFIIFILFAWPANAQVNLPGHISLDRNSFDFGDIVEGSLRYADFILTNNGTEEVYMLRADVPEDCIYRYSSQKVLPGQSATLRIKINPIEKGNFHRTINVFTSASGQAFPLYITANVKFVDRSDDYSCPDFNQTEESKIVHQDFTVQVIDRATNLPVPKARVSYVPSPGIVASRITDKDGICRNYLPVDLYDIDVNATGYEPASQTIYVGRNTTSTVILVNRLPGSQPDTPALALNTPPPPDIRKDTVPAELPAPVYKPQPGKIDTTPRTPDTTFSSLIHKVDKVLMPRKKPAAPAPEKNETQTDTAMLVKEKPGELPISHYGPNNIVFLLDVSASMMTPERLPLVKIAMKKLLYSLRSIDKVSIVTYASGVTIVLEPTSADNKEAIAKKIDALVARGNTEGGKGIREAYKVATDNFIPGGNNQIIVATDGDFDLDKSNAALYRFIKHEAAAGIIISVVGVGNIPLAIKQMQTIAEKGQGSFIPIKTKQDAENVLVDEIKQRSDRKK